MPTTLRQFVSTANVDALASAGIVAPRGPAMPKVPAGYVQHRSALHVGDFLRPGEYLASSNKLAHVILQADGNLVLYRTNDGASLWSTGTNGKKVATAALQTDGNLVLREASGNPVWEQGMSGHGGVLLDLQDDGNWVLSNAAGAPIWASDTYGFVGTRSGNKTSIITDAENDLSDAADAVAGLVNEIPGVQWLTSEFTDFARTGLGEAFLRFASPMAIPILWSVPFVGPIAASLTFAFPGLARGETLSKSFASELVAAGKVWGKDYMAELFPDAVDEIETVARQYGKLAGEFPDDAVKLMGNLAEHYGLPKTASLDELVSAFAAKTGLREDMARVAIDQSIGLAPLDETQMALAYDPATGAKKAPLNAASHTYRQFVGSPTVLANVLRPLKSSRSAVAAVLAATRVSEAKAVAAHNLAHDTLLGREGSEGYAAHLLRGGETSKDTAAMASAMANNQAILVMKRYVDKYVGLGTTRKAAL